MLFDCRYLLQQLHSPQIQHAYREQNRIADQLAKAGSFLESNMAMRPFEIPPHFVCRHFEADKQGTTLMRLIPHTTKQAIGDHDAVPVLSNQWASTSATSLENIGVPKSLPTHFFCCNHSSNRNPTNTVASTSNSLVYECKRVRPEHPQLCKHMF